MLFLAGFFDSSSSLLSLLYPPWIGGLPEILDWVQVRRISWPIFPPLSERI